MGERKENSTRKPSLSPQVRRNAAQDEAAVGVEAINKVVYLSSHVLPPKQHPERVVSGCGFFFFV